MLYDKSSPLTMQDVVNKVRSFSIGDKVQVKTEERGEEIATIKRFYKHFVLFDRSDGSTFTMTNAEAMNARLVKPAKFKIRDEAMDRTAILESLKDKKLGQ